MTNLLDLDPPLACESKPASHPNAPTGSGSSHAQSFLMKELRYCLEMLMSSLFSSSVTSPLHLAEINKSITGFLHIFLCMGRSGKDSKELWGQPQKIVEKESRKHTVSVLWQ